MNAEIPLWPTRKSGCGQRDGSGGGVVTVGALIPQSSHVLQRLQVARRHITVPKASLSRASEAHVF